MDLGVFTNTDYRYYDPATGRWVNRDPAGERGGVALYSAGRNNFIAKIDFLGLVEVDGGFGFSGHKLQNAPFESLDGFFADMAGGRDNESVGKGRTGKSLLEYLKQRSKNKCCIKTLRIASHGGPNGLGGGGQERVGFYLDKMSVPVGDSGSFDNIPVSPGFRDDEALALTAQLRNTTIDDIRRRIDAGDLRSVQRRKRQKADAGAADIPELDGLIKQGKVSFCRKCEIYLHACLQSDAFATALATATKCKVYYQQGSCDVAGGNLVNRAWKGSKRFKSVDDSGKVSTHDYDLNPPIIK